MKLGPDMHHLNTFNIPKHDGVNKWAGRDRIHQTTRKRYEIKRILTFAPSRTNSENAKGTIHTSLSGTDYCYSKVILR